MYRIYKIILFTMFSSLPVVSANAGSGNCSNPSTQMEINQCAQNELSIANKRIGKVYNQYLSTLEPKEQANLRDAQRSWVQFKEKDCKFESSSVVNCTLVIFLYRVQC